MSFIISSHNKALRVRNSRTIRRSGQSKPSRRDEAMKRVWWWRNGQRLLDGSEKGRAKRNTEKRREKEERISGEKANGTDQRSI